MTARGAQPRVLVTGGAGLIGLHIVNVLARGGYGFEGGEIVVLDNFCRGRRENLARALAHGPARVARAVLTLHVPAFPGAPGPPARGRRWRRDASAGTRARHGGQEGVLSEGAS